MEYLAELLETHGILGRIAEIGTDQGEGSTVVLQKYASEKKCQFYAIDIFRDSGVYKKISSQLAESGWKAIKGDSVAIGQKWPEGKQLDFLFIDGDHGFPHVTPLGNQTGVLLDVLTWHSNLKLGGILAFHDYTGSDDQYGNISLIAVELAVDCFCRPPAYEFIGRKGSIVAYKKNGDYILTPSIHLKSPNPTYAAAWKHLNRLKQLPPLIVYGTGGGAKYLLESVLTNLNPTPELFFTDSTTQKASSIFGGYPLLPPDEAFQKDGLIVIGSLHEKEIGRILEQHGKRHLTHYYNHFEFIGWCYVGRLWSR